jgi:AsmA family protein
MKRPARLWVPGPKTTILLGVALTAALSLALFDWNWLRPSLERHLSENTGRAVNIGDLEVQLGFSFEPTVRLRRVHVENAPWARSKRPMAVIAEVSYTFPIQTLWDEKRVVTRMVLKDAELDLEWLPDGLRNWRLRDPDYRGPTRYKVRTFETHRTHIHFARPGIELELVATSAPADSGSSIAKPDPTLPARIDFSGKYRGVAFAGAVLTSDALTIQQTGRFFPVRGHLTSGKTRIDGDAMVADLLKRSAIDASLRIAGPSLATLQPFVDLPLPSRPYRAEGRLRKNDNHYGFEQLQAKIGATDIAGELSYRDDRDAEERGRPMLRATLRSESADLADLGIVGQPDEKERASERMFPRSALGAERIKAIDAHVSIVARKFKSAAVPALESLKFTADLDDGILKLKPLELGLAGGHAIGAITLDAKRDPPSSHMAVDLRDVRLDQLLPALASMGLSSGSVSANVQLNGSGNSIAAIAGSATGSMSAKVAGARISNLLDAKLGRNFGKILQLTISGDRAIAVHCAAIAFDLNNGLGQSRAILLDTEQTRFAGSGTINLRDETLDVLLDPRPKKPGIFSLPSSVRVQGALNRPDFVIDKSARPRTLADQRHVQC